MEDSSEGRKAERWRRIAEAAYLRAEARGFAGDPVEDWLEAEIEVDRLLAHDSDSSFKGRLADELEAASHTLERLKGKAAELESELEDEWHRELARIKRQRTRIASRIAALKDTDGRAFSRVEKSWHELQAAIRKLGQRVGLG